MFKKIIFLSVTFPLFICADNARIFDEVKKGNAPYVKQCIKEGVNLNIADAQGNTPLHVAAEHGHDKIVKRLLVDTSDWYFWERWWHYWFSYYPSIDAQNNNGDSALHTTKQRVTADRLVHYGAQTALRNKQNLTPVLKASKEGNAELVAFFMAALEDYDKHTIDGNNILHLAIHHNHPRLAAQIITFNAYSEKQYSLVNGHNKNSETPIFSAVAHGDKNLVQLLLPCSAHKTSLNIQGDNLLTKACQSDTHNDDIINMLLEDEEIQNSLHKQQHKTPLYLLIKKGKINLAHKLLTKHGVSIDQKNHAGDTPMMLAIKDKNFDAINWIFNHRPDLALYNNAGETAMSIAAFQKNIELVEALKERGALLEQTFADGATLLMRLVASDKYDMAEKLVNMRASLSAQDKNGNTVMHYAASNPSTAISPFIMHSCKNQINQRNTYGATPLHVAAKSGNTAVIKQLLLLNPDLSIAVTNKELETPAHIALKNKQYECAKLLLDPASILLTDNRGNTPVDYLLQNKLPITILANTDLHPALIQHTNNNGESYLHLAIQKGHEDACKFFAHPNLINKKDKLGVSPLMNAVKQSDTKMAKILLQKGAFVNDQNHKKMSPLHYAIAHKNLSQVALLNDYGATFYFVSHSALHYAAQVGDIDIVRYIKNAVPQHLTMKNDDGDVPFVCAARYGNEDAMALLLQENTVELKRAMYVAKTYPIQSHLSELIKNREQTIKEIIEKETVCSQLIQHNVMLRSQINPHASAGIQHTWHTAETLEKSTLLQQKNILERVITRVQQEQSNNTMLVEELRARQEAKKVQQQTAPSAPPAEVVHNAAPVVTPYAKPVPSAPVIIEDVSPVVAPAVAEVVAHTCGICWEEKNVTAETPCPKCEDKATDKHICKDCFQEAIDLHDTAQHDTAECPFCRTKNVLIQRHFNELFGKSNK